MSQTSSPTRPAWRWRRLTRFGLRTLFLLTTLVGVALWGCQRYWESQLPIQELPGGVKLRGFGGTGAGKTSRPVWLGENVPFKAWDQHGRLLCQGSYVKGQATGIWSYYHTNGRVALRGKCRNGVRAGTWIAWDEQGNKTAEIEHGTPTTPPPGSALAAAPRRAGTAQQWWPDGRRRSAGEFVNDQPHGPWMYWQDGKAVHAEYVMGRPVPSVSKYMAECERGLHSKQWRERHDAVAALATAGPAAQPLWIIALQSPHVDVQLFALEALRRAGPDGHAALPDVERLTHSVEPSVAVEALLTAFVIDHAHRKDTFARLMEVLLVHLDAENLRMLPRVALLGESAVPLLEAQLEAMNADQRLLAAVILGEMYRSAFASSAVQHADFRQRLEKRLEQTAKSRDPRVAAHAQLVLDKYQRPQGGLGGGFF